MWSLPQLHPQLMLVILRDAHAQLWDLVLLIAIHHTKIGGLSQIIAALAAPRRVPVHLVIRLLDPGQVRARSTGLLAWLAFRSAALSFRLDQRRPPSRDVLAAITPNTYNVCGSASASITARASLIAMHATIAT